MPNMWGDPKFEKTLVAKDLTPYILFALFHLAGKAHKREVAERLRDLLDMSEEVSKREVKKKSPPIMVGLLEEQADWAATGLRKTKHLKPATGTGIVEWTEKGRESAKELIDRPNDSSVAEQIRQEFIKQTGWFAANTKSSNTNKNKNQDNVNFEDIPEGTAKELEVDEVSLQKEKDLLTITEDIDPREFELICIELLRKMGAEIVETPYVGDHGIDGIGHFEIGLLNFKFVIQVKRYKPTIKVKEKEIRELLGSKDGENAEKAIFITTSSFTSAARKYAQEKLVRLIDGYELIDLLREYEIGYQKTLTIEGKQE